MVTVALIVGAEPIIVLFGSSVGALPITVRFGSLVSI
jgi:hypothetical protein